MRPPPARIVLFAEVPCFYAAVERADDPNLAARPVIVGGDPRKRGLVVAASPDAYAAGVALEMPMLEALQRCPAARRMATDMTRYREVSRRLFAVLRQGVEGLEGFGLGAAFVDATAQRESPEAIGTRLCELVQADLGLPLRVGIGPSKFVARLAAEEAGPAADAAGAGAVRRILPDQQVGFLRPLSVTRLDGVGEKTAATLAELGALTIGDVVSLGPERLEEVLGTHGLRIHALAGGEDSEPVRAARHPQSLSREVTIRSEPRDLAVLVDELQALCVQLEAELRRQGLCAAKVALKVRYADQATTTRSQALGARTAAAADIHSVAARLLERTQAGSRPIRGLGIQLARLAPEAESERQLDLFPSSG